MGEAAGSIIATLILASLIGFVWYWATQEGERYRASPEFICAKQFGTATSDYAMCVYELQQGLRKEP